MPRTRAARVRRGLLIGVPVVSVVLLVLVLIAAQFADDARGCGSIDPTDPANYSAITIINDSNQPIRVTNCRGPECDISGSSILDQGQQLKGHAACASAGKDMTSYEIDSPESGALLGYVVVNVAHSDAHPTYRTSHLSTDRNTPTPTS